MSLDMAQAQVTVTEHKRGPEELIHVQGQGQQPGGATPRPRSEVAAESTRQRQHRSSREELPHV